jgi:hypothetical protein
MLSEQVENMTQCPKFWADNELVYWSAVDKTFNVHGTYKDKYQHIHQTPKLIRSSSKQHLIQMCINQKSIIFLKYTGISFEEINLPNPDENMLAGTSNALHAKETT